MGYGSHAGLSKESLIITCKTVHLPFQINFNLTQGFHGNPRWLPVGCIPSAGGGQACSQMPRSPAKTRLLPQLKCPFYFESGKQCLLNLRKTRRRKWQNLITQWHDGWVRVGETWVSAGRAGPLCQWRQKGPPEVIAFMVLHVAAFKIKPSNSVLSYVYQTHNKREDY